MTSVKDSKLYKTLKKAVREEDHAELLRMLEMVNPRRACADFSEEQLMASFVWNSTPQGGAYWAELSNRIRKAGHDCY